MKQWVEHIRAIDAATGDRCRWDVGFHFGDWLALDGENGDAFKGATEEGYIATAYYYHSASLAAKAAARLGKRDDAERYGQLAQEIKQGLQREYFTPNGRLALTTQTAYALALSMDFAPEGSKPRLAELLLEKLKAKNGHLQTGFVGTAILNQALSDHGGNEMAYKLLLNEDYPSWVYAVNLGATTVWERWDSVQPDWRIGRCDMKYLSAAGPYEIHWQMEADGDFALQVCIPFGAEAEIVLPNSAAEPIHAESGRHEFRYRPEPSIRKRYSKNSALSELLENPAAKAIATEFLPRWETIPLPMRDMPLPQLNATPFANLTDAQMAALDARLKTL